MDAEPAVAIGKDFAIIGAFILVTFFILLFIINRYNLSDLRALTGHGSPDVLAHSLRVEQPMCRVYNPFSLSLLHPGKASLNGEVRFQLQSHVECWVGVYGGILIADVYPMIHASWSQLQNFTAFRIRLREISQFQQELTVSEVGAEEILVRPTDVCLGSAPRSRYPLVVFIINRKLLDRSESELCSCTEIVMMACVVHVRDDGCTAESDIIAQLVRTPLGSVHDLKKLYVSESSTSNWQSTQAPPTSTAHTIPADSDWLNPSMTSDSYHGSRDEADPADGPGASYSVRETVCVVCQADSVHRALLPCRHACVCNACFSALQHCPMCRTLIVNSIDLLELGFH